MPSDLLMLLMVSHIFLLAAGSTPVVGSSSSMTWHKVRRASCHLGAAYQSQGNIELPLVASAVCATGPVQVLAQVHKAAQGLTCGWKRATLPGKLLQLLVNDIALTAESSDASKESKHLSTSKHLKVSSLSCKW